MQKTILIVLFTGLYLLFSACRQQAGGIPDTSTCAVADSLVEASRISLAEGNPELSDSLARRAARLAELSGNCVNTWVDARVEVVRCLRKIDPKNGMQRSVDTLLADVEKLKPVHPELTGRLEIQLAFAYGKLNDYWSALPHYEAARQCYEQSGVTVTTNSGRSLYKPLANIYTRLGETEKAIQLLTIGLDTAFQQNDTIGILKIYSDLGLAYFDVGRVEDACKQYERGLNFLAGHPVEDTRQVLDIRTNLLGNYAEALLKRFDPAPDSAKLLAEAALALDDSYTPALVTLGDIAAQNGQPGETDAYYRQAEALYSGDPLPLDRELAKLLLRRAQFLSQSAGAAQTKNVLSLCQRALHHVLPAFRPVNNAQNPQPQLFYPENTILEALDLKSKTLWAAYQAQSSNELLTQADSTTALALDMSDTLSSIYGFESSKLYSLENTRNLYERYLQILFEQYTRRADPGAAERIALFLEKSRANLLRQKLAGEYALQAAPISGDLRQREDRLRRELVYLRNELAVEEAETIPDAALVKRLRNRIFQTNEARQQLMHILERDFPDYFDAHYARPVASLADIRSLLEHDDALFAEYFYNPESGALYAIGITRTGTRLFRGTLASANLEAFLAFVQDEALGRNREGDETVRKEFIQEARMLYDTLVAPLAGDMALHEMIVSPDGSLGSLPFDLLLPRPPGPEEQSFRRMPYLLRQTRVRFAASATVLRDARALAGRANGRGYFGAAPAYPSNGFFAPVQYGSACVRDLAALFRGQLVLNGKATRDRFCAGAPACQVLHFYGHGSANGNRPELSYLAFAGGSSTGQHQGEYHTLAAAANLPATEAGHVLFAHEISLLRLRAGLVVLSACETGLGRAAGSEGIFSLARAFQDAGCPSAAMTLWSVDDKATARLTDLFLQNIRAGKPKDEALQQAKLSFLENFDGSVFPFYWSGMVLTGDATALDIQPEGCRFVVGDETVSCALLGLLTALLVFAAGMIVLIFRR